MSRNLIWFLVINAILNTFISLAHAQSSPGWPYGYVPTAGQWNAAFAAKQNTLGFTPLNIAGGTMTGRLNLAPSNSSQAMFNVGVGSTPTMLLNGDMWNTNAGLFIRQGGVTIPIGGGTGTVTSVASGFTGGLISVAGSPITTSGTLAFTVAGTSGGVPYFSGATAWGSSALLGTNALMLGGGAGNPPTAKLTSSNAAILNMNATTAPTPVSGTVLQVTGANSAAAFIESNSFGGTPIFTGRRADGTNASPTAVQSGDTLAGFSARPYDGTAYTSVSVANVQVVAAENFGVGAHGANINFNCTAPTTTTAAQCGLITSTGFQGAIGITTPAIGHFTSITGTLAGATGLPISTGVSGLGTGVATALAVNANASGGVTLLNGAATSGHCLQWSASGVQDSGAACGTGTVNLTVGSTTTSGGGAGQLMFDSGPGTFQEATGLLATNTTLTVSGGSLILSGNQSAAAWTTNGLRLKGVAGTLTDTSSSGTVAAQYTDVLGGNTIAASSATTYTKYASLHLNAPVAGTNVTLTSNPALDIAGANNSYAATIAGGSTTGSATIGVGLNITGTMNSSGVVDGAAIFANITDTASAAATSLVDIQVASSSVLMLRKNFTGGWGLTFNGSTSAGISADGSNVYFGTTGAIYGAARSGVTSGGPTGFEVSATGAFGFSSVAGPANNSDVVLTRKAAASLQLGYADAAAPVAQTLGVQSVVAGTSNTAGADFTIAASQGTGTGAGGNIVLKAAAAGTTGTAQNALVTAMTVTSKQVLANIGTAALPGYGFSANAGIGIFNNANVLAFAQGGNELLDIYSNKLQLGSAVQLSFFGTIMFAPTAATFQYGDVDAAAPVAQGLKVQSVVAGTTNTAGSAWTITGSLSTGSGLSGDILFKTGNTGAGATAQNTATTALTIKGATQNVIAAANLDAATYTVGGATGVSCTLTTVAHLTVVNGIVTLCN